MSRKDRNESRGIGCVKRRENKVELLHGTLAIALAIAFLLTPIAVGSCYAARPADYPTIMQYVNNKTDTTLYLLDIFTMLADAMRNSKNDQQTYESVLSLVHWSANMTSENMDVIVSSGQFGARENITRSLNTTWANLPTYIGDPAGTTGLMYMINHSFREDSSRTYRKMNYTLTALNSIMYITADFASRMGAVFGNESSAPSRQVLYDDFRQADGPALGWKPQSGNWTVIDEEYVGTNRPGDSPTSGICAVGQTFDNFTLGFNLRIEEGSTSSNNDWAAVQIRKDEPDDGWGDSGYLIFYRQNGWINVYQAPGVLLSSSDTGCNLSQQQCCVRIIATSDRIKIYAGSDCSTLRINKATANYTNGYLSLANYQSKAYFDDIILTMNRPGYPNALQAADDMTRRTGYLWKVTAMLAESMVNNPSRFSTYDTVLSLAHIFLDRGNFYLEAMTDDTKCADNTSKFINNTANTTPSWGGRPSGTRSGLNYLIRYSALSGSSTQEEKYKGILEFVEKGSPMITDLMVRYPGIYGWEEYYDSFDDGNYGRWSTSGDTSKVGWSVVNGQLKSTVSTGGAYSYIKYDDLYVTDYDGIEVEYDVYFSGSADYGGLWYRGTYFNINPTFYGINDDSITGYTSSGISHDKWHNIKAIITKNSSTGYDYSTVYVDGAIAAGGGWSWDHEPVENASYGNDNVGFVSTNDSDYVTFDNVSITEVPYKYEFYEEFDDANVNDFEPANWTVYNGAWSADSGGYRQTLTTGYPNTNAYASLYQNNKTPITYEWSAKYNSGAMSGVHIFAGNGSTDGRGPSYLIWQDVNTMRIYEASSAGALSDRASWSVSNSAGQTHRYKVRLDPVSARIDIWRNGTYIGGWTDPTPISDSGSGYYISLMTNAADVTFDDIRIRGDIGLKMLRDQFTEPDGSASGWTIVNGAWQVDSYQYEYTGDLASTYHANTYIGNRNWDDYVIDLEGAIVSGGNLAVGFRTNTTTGARYNVSITSGGTLAIKRVSDWDAATVTSLGTATVTSPGTSKHRIKIAAIGEQFTVWYDGVKKLTVVDGAYPNGAISLEAIGTDQVLYDNITVYASRDPDYAGIMSYMDATATSRKHLMNLASQFIDGFNSTDNRTYTYDSLIGLMGWSAARNARQLLPLTTSLRSTTLRSMEALSENIPAIFGPPNALYGATYIADHTLNINRQLRQDKTDETLNLMKKMITPITQSLYRWPDVYGWVDKALYPITI